MNDVFFQFPISYSMKNDSLLRRRCDFIYLYIYLSHLLWHVCCALIVFPFAEKMNHRRSLLHFCQGFTMKTQLFAQQPEFIGPNKLADDCRCDTVAQFLLV